MSATIKIELDNGQFINAVHKTPKKDSSAGLRRKLVLMIHGFPGDLHAHNNLYGDMEFLLNDKGFHTLRFDFLGCGESSGNTKDVTLGVVKRSFNAIKDWADENGYQELLFISEGLGSIFALLNLEINVKCQVLLWPGLDPQYIAKQIFKLDTINETDRKFGYVTYDNYHVSIKLIEQLANLNMAPVFKDVNMPVLIMHGSADEIFPIEHLNIIRQKASSKRIEITTFHEGAHGLPELKHRKSMYFHILQFLEKFA